jgi:hypothetical protein
VFETIWSNKQDYAEHPCSVGPDGAFLTWLLHLPYWLNPGWDWYAVKELASVVGLVVEVGLVVVMVGGIGCSGGVGCNGSGGAVCSGGAGNTDIPPATTPSIISRGSPESREGRYEVPEETLDELASSTTIEGGRREVDGIPDIEANLSSLQTSISKKAFSHRRRQLEELNLYQTRKADQKIESECS